MILFCRHVRRGLPNSVGAKGIVASKHFFWQTHKEAAEKAKRATVWFSIGFVATFIVLGVLFNQLFSVAFNLNYNKSYLEIFRDCLLLFFSTSVSSNVLVNDNIVLGGRQRDISDKDFRSKWRLIWILLWALVYIIVVFLLHIQVHNASIL